MVDIASSGTINNTFRTGYAVRIAWSVSTQDIATNTSTLTASVQLVSLGSSYTISNTGGKWGSITIDGVAYGFGFTNLLQGNETKTVFTKTVKITHGNDGSKTCPISCKLDVDAEIAGTYYEYVSSSGNAALNDIPRESTISSITASVEVNGTNQVAIGISRDSSSFTHTIVISFGSYSATLTGITTATSYTIPMTWLNAIPNAVSGTAKATITTYNGSTKVGNATSRTFTLTVPASVVPSITSVGITEATEGLAEDFGVFIQNKSSLNVDIVAAGAYSSTIRTYKTTINGIDYHGDSITTGIITTSGTLSFTITVTDSRGRTSTTTRSRQVVAYSQPIISTFKTYRSNSSGVQQYDGCCVCCVVKFNISPINNLNDKSYAIEIKQKNSSTWETLGTGSVYSFDNTVIYHDELTIEQAYDIRLTITDSFISVVANNDLPAAFTLIDFHNGGGGLAIGKVAEYPNALEIGIDVIDKFGGTVRNGMAYYQSGGSTDPDTTIEELILTMTNVPLTGKFFFIRTMFYNAKNTTASRVQYAYPYNNSDSTYFRYYTGGSWTDWMEQPIVIEQGKVGIFDYKKYSDGTTECVGKINLSGIAVSSALGGWYRSEYLYEATAHPYPVAFSDAPAVEMMFQTRNNSAALLWPYSASYENAKAYLPQCYLIRPTTASYCAGNINIIVKG